MDKQANQDTLSIALDVLLDALDAPTVLVAQDYRIRAANRAYCEAYGVTADAVVGRTCHEVSHGSSVPCHLHGERCPHREVFESGASCDVEHVHRLADGGYERVAIRAHLVRDHAGTPYLMESVRKHDCAQPAEHVHQLNRIEAEVIRNLLAQRYNRREIAARLGISERTLYRKLNKHGLSEDAADRVS